MPSSCNQGQSGQQWMSVCLSCRFRINAAIIDGNMNSNKLRSHPLPGQLLPFVLTLLILLIARNVFNNAEALQVLDPGTQNAAFERTGIVQDLRIDEASGMACSIQNESMLWMHNDSGDRPRLFLVDQQGKTQCVVELKEMSAFDWEDMCSFELDGQAWLLVADVGDNAKKRGLPSTPGANPVCRLLLIPEPKISPDQAEVRLSVSSIIDFTYEDGVTDCESIAVDADARQILLVSKSLPHKCSLYSIPLNTQSGYSTVVASRIMGLGIPLATGMDISANGLQMVITSPLNAVLIHRQKAETWGTACGRPGTPINLPPRKQGETICFSRSADHLWVNSEGTRQPLWRIHLKNSGVE